MLLLTVSYKLSKIEANDCWKVLRKKLTNLPILYNRMERIITISPKLLIYKIILFSASHILAGCVTASAILFAATNDNNNSSDTSKTTKFQC